MRSFVRSALALHRPLVCLFPLVSLCLAASGVAVGAEATVAVAANFSEAAKRLVQRFESASGHRVRLVSGSTGKLFAQIVNSAPFDVFLAADTATPSVLVERGFGIGESQFTYALGRLVLWSADPQLLQGDGAAILRQERFRTLAIANPELAPYGLAARQTLAHLGLWRRLASRIARGENVGQAHTLVATGNAELGFVARSFLSAEQASSPVLGSRWDVPAYMHDPIRQDAVLTAYGKTNAAAFEFLAFVRSAAAGRIIHSFGYAAERP
ncbi:MAG: molybdate ABC transporter substrate-binding protein [Gammaproteobacteria bacterium]|nr:molybdate ABC transporter substrate-binding protein [Gammaproteobacteria bacterium]